MHLTDEQVLTLSSNIIKTIADFAEKEVKDLNIKEVLYCLEITKNAVYKASVNSVSKGGK